MARPPSDDPHVHTITLRLNAEDHALLEALVEARAAELADEGLPVTTSAVVRSLIRREARAKGLSPARKSAARPQRRGNR